MAVAELANIVLSGAALTIAAAALRIARRQVVLDEHSLRIAERESRLADQERPARSALVVSVDWSTNGGFSQVTSLNAPFSVTITIPNDGARDALTLPFLCMALLACADCFRWPDEDAVRSINDLTAAGRRRAARRRGRRRQRRLIDPNPRRAAENRCAEANPLVVVAPRSKVVRALSLSRGCEMSPRRAAHYCFGREAGARATRAQHERPVRTTLRLVASSGVGREGI